MLDYGIIAKNIRDNLETYIQENQIKSLVIGVSGGIDSALCCALAKPVCDKLEIPLIGRSIAIETNKQDEIDRANAIGEGFCTEFKHVDLTAFYKSSCMALMDIESKKEDLNDIDFKIRCGNVKARIRMIRLFDLARKTRGMVLSTDNLTEYFLGFWTLHGDVGNYGMIQNLWKTEVYELTGYILQNELQNGKKYCNDNGKKFDALNDTKLAIPTDGLGISGSDLEQICAKTYQEVDEILKSWLCKDRDSFYYDEIFYYENRSKNYEEFEKYRKTLEHVPIILRHRATHFKRNDPFNIRRNDIVTIEIGFEEMRKKMKEEN